MPNESSQEFRITRLDLSDVVQRDAWLHLLDHYARDPMGGGRPLAAEVLAELPGRLAHWPGFTSALASAAGQPIGLLNAFLGFSTFAARPLLNIHDIVVTADWRGRGVAQALLAWAEVQARALGCCKLTLEVLSANANAMRSYERAGFRPYELDPAAGQALLMQKIF